MGSTRNLLILVAVLVLMGLGYFLSSRQRDRLDQSGGVVDVVEGTLSTSELYGLAVYRGDAPDEGFTLARRGDDWVMTSRFDSKANMNKLRTLLGNLESLEGEFRSDDPAVLDAYGLDDAEAVHLVLLDESGGERLHLLVGKTSGAGGFIREQGSDVVLISNRNLLSDFGIWGEDKRNPDSKAWLDLELRKLERDEVSEIALHKAGYDLVMEKQIQSSAEDDTTAAVPGPTDYEWQVSVPESFMAMKTRADGILTTITNLRARDVAAQPASAEEYGLGADADRIEVTLSDGTELVFLLGVDDPEDEGQFYFMIEGDVRYWLMPSYIRGNIFKDIDELKPN